MNQTNRECLYTEDMLMIKGSLLNANVMLSLHKDVTKKLHIYFFWSTDIK